MSLNLGQRPRLQSPESTASFVPAPDFQQFAASAFLQFQCRSTDGQAAMIATYFIFRGTKSAKRAENPCPPRKYLASTAIYRLYTFCCQFARAFFRISDKKFSKFKSCPFSLPVLVFLHRKDETFSRKVVVIAQIAGVEREKGTSHKGSSLALSVRSYGFASFPKRGGPWQSPQTSSFCQSLLRSAALSQKVALQISFSTTALLVKMGYRNARRRSDSPKSKIILPLNMPRATRRAFKIVLLAKGATTHHLCSGSFFMIAYFRLNFSGSKSGSSQKRVMISV